MESLSQHLQLKLGRWVFVTICFNKSWQTVGLALLCVHVIAVFCQAQPLRNDDLQQLPPGAIGHRQLLRSDPLREYHSQPVRISAPDGGFIASFDGAEQSTAYGQLNVDLNVGDIYRYRVSEITGLGATELYPSIEVIDRLYPPAGREREFPIPVELSADDLKLAANGKYVTRVIYIEDPDDTFPYAESDTGEDKPTSDRNADQRYFEVPPGEDPYHVARVLGRPVAILRIGNRAPTTGADSEFTFNAMAKRQLAARRLTAQQLAKRQARILLERQIANNGFSPIQPVTYDRPMQSATKPEPPPKTTRPQTAPPRTIAQRMQTADEANVAARVFVPTASTPFTEDAVISEMKPSRKSFMSRASDLLRIRK